MSDKTLGEYKRTTPDPDETTGEALARLQAEMTRLLDEADAELRDEAAGGVAAALIEKEAQGTVGALIAELEHHRARAEKAEKERDEVAGALDTTMGRAIKAERERDEARKAVEAMRAEMLACDVHNGSVIPESHPLTPDAVTDQLVDYVHEDYFWSTEDRVRLEKPALKHALQDAVKRLTEPPQRPDWMDDAERMEAVLREEWTFSDEDGGDDAFLNLAERLAQRGVRVVTKEDPR